MGMLQILPSDLSFSNYPLFKQNSCSIYTASNDTINYTDAKASEDHAAATFRIKVITVRMQSGYSSNPKNVK
jgi:hypothetical protein